jgi:hypothetical protein
MRSLQQNLNLNLKAFHRIQMSGALKNILCIFNSIGTVRGYQTKQIVDNNQAPLGLVISTVATGTVSDPVQYRTSPGIADPHPRGVFFSALEF